MSLGNACIYIFQTNIIIERLVALEARVTLLVLYRYIWHPDSISADRGMNSSSQSNYLFEIQIVQSTVQHQLGLDLKDDREKNDLCTATKKHG
jgi:hypothetical protein